MIFFNLVPRLDRVTSRREINRSASCSGKKKYDSFQQASSELRFIRRKLDMKDPMRVYHCTYCNSFHIGSAEK